MIISIINPEQSTLIFSGIFFLVLLLSTRRRRNTELFPITVTTELKGLAILMIVFSHIGYFLVNNNQFLYPLSTAAGVGVDLFLLLSGYGLAVSQFRQKLTIKQFYKKRLAKLFVPFWLMLISFLSLDFFILHLVRPGWYVGQAVFGIFLQADLYHDLNAPLWYLTLILAYYLIFPWIFFRKKPWLSAIILYFLGYLLVFWNPPFLIHVAYLYKLHIIAFPLGVLLAGLVLRLKNIEIVNKFTGTWSKFLYYLILAFLLFIFVYTNTHSGIGGNNFNLEQIMSIIGVLSLLGVFILKEIDFKLFYWFGLYSYEIYLLHWPIMYRYDFIYRFLPANLEWLGVGLYLIFFLGLAWLMSWWSKLIINYFWKKPVKLKTDQK